MALPSLRPVSYLNTFVCFQTVLHSMKNVGRGLYSRGTQSLLLMLLLLDAPDAMNANKIWMGTTVVRKMLTMKWGHTHTHTHTHLGDKKVKQRAHTVGALRDAGRDTMPTVLYKPNGLRWHETTTPSCDLDEQDRMIRTPQAQDNMDDLYCRQSFFHHITRNRFESAHTALGCR
jgi:hypothetical protein